MRALLNPEHLHPVIALLGHVEPITSNGQTTRLVELARRRAGPAQACQVLPLGREHLHAMVAVVRDEQALTVERQPGRLAELARIGTGLAEAVQKRPSRSKT